MLPPVVLDFLFTYYSHRPARLEEWHPGPGVVLLGGADVPRPARLRRGTTAASRLDPAALPRLAPTAAVRPRPAHRHRGAAQPG